MRISERCVSVIIPSRDGSDTIERALDSLRSSSALIREVYLVFSNSPEGYMQRCQELPARYAQHFALRLLDSGEHSNGSVARNAPLDVVTSRYVAYLDDDDEWFDGKLATYMDAIQDLALDGSDFVLFSTVVGCQEDRSQPYLVPSRSYLGEPVADFILSFGGGAQTSSLLLPTTLAQQVRFDPLLPRHQDYDFCIRLDEHGAVFHHIDRPLSYWYQRGSNAAKGGSFEFCTRWVLSQRHRLSETAFLGYVGKEIFAAARASGDWASFHRFLREHLGRRQRWRVLWGLGLRALRIKSHGGSTPAGAAPRAA